MDQKNCGAFVFQCNLSGLVQSIQFCENQNNWLKEQSSFSELVYLGSTNKAELFLDRISRDGIACEWEIFAPDENLPQKMIITGFKEGESIWVLGANSRVGLLKLIIGMLNDQPAIPLRDKTILNTCIYESFLNQEDEQDLDDDLSRINSEILVVQRELFKNKAKLEQINLQIQNQAAYLEEELEKRSKELVISEARFRGVFEATSIGVIILDLNGRIIETNAALQKIIDIKNRNKILRHVTDLPFFSDFTEYQQLVDALTSGKKDSHLIRRQFTGDNQIERWADIHLFLVKDQVGNPIYAINMVEDVTEQVNTQAALIRAEKLSIAGQLAASLAHEVNNPLQVIIGNLGLAQEASHDGESIDRYLSISMEELRRIARIVAQLRDINKPIKQRDYEQINLYEILQNALFLADKKLLEKGIKLEKHLDPKIPAFNGSGDQFQQVFLNLILNAIDAMPQGGKLMIKMNAEKINPETIRILFKDNGMGIKKQDLTRIFEPFFTTKQDGLGLGLYIVSDIIKSYGGSIDIQSIENKGTTIQIILPVG